ncbi:hypothetical protein [Lutibacter sp.]|uniref:hypothetical protein n=1 Tax=Lutibacter sp. TaxID=1925666 RepID=UPI001A20730E|nr:hypothetical protein [Lutibacter sp.]MBI9041969.1 hypothetical protein [Lutibacter sp.]
MGLLSFLGLDKSNPIIEEKEPLEEQFIDKSEPLDLQDVAINKESYGLYQIFDYASTDFEQRGYQDALINPDSSYKQENIDLLIEDLYIKIRQAKNHYTTKLKTLDFHIKSRNDAGLIDIVDELESKKSIIVQNFEEVLKIEEETKDKKGLIVRLKLSYTRGFNRGLASLSNKILNTEV